MLIVLVPLLTFHSCKSREKEKELNDKEIQLNEKEQELLLREKTLEFREQEFAERIRMADSMRLRDTSSILQNSLHNHDSANTNPALTGNWTVKMTCVETSCPGSAIGDTRNEQWNLSYEGNHLVARASVRGNLIRTYSGIYNINTIELIEHRDSAMLYDTRMVVRLRVVNDNAIEGQREIIRENECKIVYALTMNKQ